MLLYGLKVHDEHENKTVEGATSIMDQLAVLGEEISGLYHMHDILLKFVKENSEERADIHQSGIWRWTPHISCLNVSCETDVYMLAGLWHALNVLERRFAKVNTVRRPATYYESCRPAEVVRGASGR